MPLYEYLCPDGHRIELLRSYENRPRAVRCRAHDAVALLVPSLMAPHHGGDSPIVTGNGDMRFPYTSPTFGCEVTSMAHHRALCKQHNLEWAPDYDAKVSRREIDAAAAEEDQIAEEYYDELENAPAYAKFRDLRDKGYFNQDLPAGAAPPATMPSQAYAQGTIR